MDAEAQHVMRCENIQPDTWIVPPRMTSFAAMGQLAETEVWRAGEATARGNLLKGEDNFATFRGKSCYEIKPYQLDVDGRVVRLQNHWPAPDLFGRWIPSTAAA